MSHHRPSAEPETKATRDGRLPDEIRHRIVMHGETTPYHRRLQQEQGVDYADLHTWDDLRTTFSYLDDQSLRALDPDDFVPDHYSETDLIPSQSSGTTGPVKTIYWHREDVEANLDYIESTLRETVGTVPTDSHWVATTTPNPVLTRTLEGLADRFESTIDIVEVDPKPVKRALQSGDKQRLAEVLDPIADRLHELFKRKEVEVYEDIAPLMRYVGSRLPDEYCDRLRLLLIGGVGTDHETVDHLTNETFPNAMLTGWYGDYMTGSTMMCPPESLAYRPQIPDVRLEVRDPTNRNTVVPIGETGEVVAHAIRRGFFIPNRRIDDLARRIRINTIDGITDIRRKPR